MGVNRGIFGGIRKVSIRLYWNSISNVVNVESRIYKGKNGEQVEKVETSKMVTSLDKTEEVMGHGVGDAVTETMEFNGTETDVEGKEEAKADEDEFQALTDGEVETVQVDTREPKNVENEQGGIGDQSVQAEDDEKKKGARKALFKKTTAITMGTSKMRFVQAVLSPRKNAHAKPGKRHGGGDGARQTEDKGPLNPKPSSSKPWIKSQEVLWSDKWWGWGVFHYFLSISSMSISLLLGIGVLWHCFGRWVYVFLVLLVLVLCWNKLGAFIASTISSRSWLIGTVSLFVMYWFIWTLRFWFWDVSHTTRKQRHTEGKNRRYVRYYGGKLVLGISRWFNEMGGD
ncbi:uncharacterized protein LOC125585876 [Brassica napus]|uniref:uncharacterized protein LOC125585876 n=1 Tax=Brassica napus TaxID=3708 RepID=UPI002079C927|nr:uncharacterized protein LOC125585876 [Brassica napus]